jgi:F-type H+-transporting ATPase subunit c
MKKLGATGVLAALMLLATVGSAFAADGAEGGRGLLALGAGLGLGIAAAGCGVGQGRAVASALESIGRNPNAAGRIQTPMIIGLAFMESLTIYALIIAFTLSGKI